MQYFVILLLFSMIKRVLLCRKEAGSQKDKHHSSAPNKVTEISKLARARACQHMAAEITVLAERKLQVVGYCYPSEESEKIP